MPPKLSPAWMRASVPGGRRGVLDRGCPVASGRACISELLAASQAQMLTLLVQLAALRLIKCSPRSRLACCCERPWPEYILVLFVVAVEIPYRLVSDRTELLRPEYLDTRTYDRRHGLQHILLVGAAAIYLHGYAAHAWILPRP
jgi:hypothetical protein